MSQETFLNFRKFIWLWINLFVVTALSVLYFVEKPVGGRNGGTVYGYSVGILATVAILHLMWFGIRKRSYSAHIVTLKGWLAAHVWLGVALLIIVPLHAAFRFGLNIHTLAYVVMSLVIISGIWGAVNYQILPKETMSNRGGGALRLLLEQFEALDSEIRAFKQGKSTQFEALVTRLNFDFKPNLFSCLIGRRTKQLDEKSASALLNSVPDSERKTAVNAVGAIGKKRALAAKFEDEIAVRAKLKLWLYCHVPLSVGLLLLVAIHIVSVFYFY